MVNLDYFLNFVPSQRGARKDDSIVFIMAEIIPIEPGTDNAV